MSVDGPAALTIAEVSGEVLHTTAEALATGQTAGVLAVFFVCARVCVSFAHYVLEPKLAPLS